MARYNDNSCDHTRWSMPHLLREIRKYANMEGFDGDLDMDLMKPWSGTEVGRKMNRCGDAVREATRLYRDTWLNPLLDEVERRDAASRKPRAVRS